MSAVPSWGWRWVIQSFQYRGEIPFTDPRSTPQGILLSNVLQQLWSDSGTIFYDDDSGDVSETITRRHRTVRIHHRRNRSSRTHMHIPGAPDPDPPAVQRHRRTKHNVPDQPFTSQWEGLQAPIDRRIGLENEVLELRRRASAAAGEVRRLREEKKWAIAQGNKAREFQLSLWVECVA